MLEPAMKATVEGLPTCWPASDNVLGSLASAPAHAAAARGRRAIFLDRDGTLTHPYHYPSRPEHLRLYDGIAEPLRALARAGFALVVVTNQSGIARGYFSTQDLERMHDALRQALTQQGVKLDSIEHCPHHPDGAVPELAIRCGCRKPAPGMLVRAAHALQVDLSRSWMVGDILDDIEAGHRAGCRSLLVDVGSEPMPQRPERWPFAVGRDTRHALEIILAAEGQAQAPSTYWPEQWLLAQAPPGKGTVAGRPEERGRRKSDTAGATNIVTPAQAGGSHGRTC